jgi:glycerol-3-phosphate acyltransferase PlsX
MGEAFAHAVFNLERPIVGLLNIGSEELKGNDAVRGAAQILRTSTLPIAIHGVVEGKEITEGLVEVVVTDGFTGNIALKTAEGAAKLVGQYLRRALTRSLLSKLGAFLAKGALNTLRRNLDPRASSGGIFLGLNGIVVKAHGGTDAIGFAGAISMAIDMSKADLNARIAADHRKLEPVLEQAALT